MLFQVHSKNNLNYRNVCGFYPSPRGKLKKKKECESASVLFLVPLLEPTRASWALLVNLSLLKNFKGKSFFNRSVDYLWRGILCNVISKLHCTCYIIKPEQVFHEKTVELTKTSVFPSSKNNERRTLKQFVNSCFKSRITWLKLSRPIRPIVWHK